MRIVSMIAAAALTLAAATSALACSGYSPQQNVQSPMPADALQQTAQTLAPAGALTVPTETAETAKAGTPTVKAN